eukprot:Gb_25362 [translate_table: standard]
MLEILGCPYFAGKRFPAVPESFLGRMRSRNGLDMDTRSPGPDLGNLEENSIWLVDAKLWYMGVFGEWYEGNIIFAWHYGTGAQNHPNFGLLTEHGLSATSTPTVDFEDEIRCFEVCKGVIPCSEQGAQCNLTGDAKVCKNGKYGSSCSIKRSQYGMFSKMASYKQEGVFRQKKQDIFKCVRKLGEQEPSKKDKGQRARCANATCSKSYKRYVANSTRKELDNVNSKEPNIAKRYFGFIQMHSFVFHTHTSHIIT